MCSVKIKTYSIDTNIIDEIEGRRITEIEAMQRAGIASRSTFYRRLKECKKA